ncbi:hypothetical protein DBR43_01065 [Pedobacter sp. KBW06]|uniref:DUF2931 family protein n=1 Tax=Pedobacter sp. KBW06 TaxID=2153359 RepID=UPI000F5A2BC2|nr:DUF2931 family protein [Pedobacter sp. KBW06]RQO74028.1 hypothetical protein DBR43_01065 [Pedobacter sp. KBW06]
MKKLNVLNKIYLLIFVLLVIAIAVKLLNYKGWSRYYYSASVSAPRMYPIKVYRADFVLSDGKTESLKTSDVNDQRLDWGQGEFSQTSERQQLPVKLVLDYVSYRDQSFYKDTINLPAQLIDSIFRNSKKAGIQQSIHKYGTNADGLVFIAGIANNGNVLVWLQGDKYERVLLKHKIAAREPSAADLFNERQLTKEQYLKQAFADLSDDFFKNLAEGLAKDANYIDSASNYLR